MPMPRRMRTRGKGHLASQDVVAQVDVDALSSAAKYYGSNYHCAKRPRQWMPHKTKCPEGIDDAHALRLLRRGIEFGVFSANLDSGWPRQVWAVDADGRVYEARLTNREVGEYHGYPMASGDRLTEDVAKRWGKAR